MKPFLKWVGGKTQIIHHILSRFPTDLHGNYHEPFLGGGSVLFAFLDQCNQGAIRHHGSVFASDLNPHLIAVYRAIQSDPLAFMDSMEALVTLFEQSPLNLEEFYYHVREEFNRQPDPVRFLFLNKTCFRGIYREGPRGNLNVPYGHYRNPCILDRDHIMEISALIQRVTFEVQSFEHAMQRAAPGDFVYLDPPYVATFAAYTAAGFSHETHQKLFTLCRELPCPFLLSNSDAPLVRESFPEEGFHTEVILCKRTINSKHPESKTPEVLVRAR